MAALPCAWPYRVSARTGWPSVSIQWLDDLERFICNISFSVAARNIAGADQSLGKHKHVAGTLRKQAINQQNAYHFQDFINADKSSGGVYHPVCILVLALHTGSVCLLVACLTSQQHAGVSQGRICTDNITCCHTEIEVAHQTFYLTQSQYTDIGPTSPSTDPITPGAWQGSHWSANF